MVKSEQSDYAYLARDTGNNYNRQQKCGENNMVRSLTYLESRCL
jgi:hypothetical protein